jgi:hypothetical protein
MGTASGEPMRLEVVPFPLGRLGDGSRIRVGYSLLRLADQRDLRLASSRRDGPGPLEPAPRPQRSDGFIRARNPDADRADLADRAESVPCGGWWRCARSLNKGDGRSGRRGLPRPFPLSPGPGARASARFHPATSAGSFCGLLRRRAAPFCAFCVGCWSPRRCVRRCIPRNGVRVPTPSPDSESRL